jgi:hypothetical protein
MPGQGAEYGGVEAVSPSAAAVLDAWEGAQTSRLGARVVSLLKLVYDGRSGADLLNLPLGQRNRALLALHLALVGPDLECVVQCPECQELNELSLQASALMLPAGVTPPDGLSASAGDWTFQFRLPNTADLVFCLSRAGLSDMRRAMAERCLLSVEPALDGALPDPLIDALARAVSESDPAAELLFHLDCVGCQQRFSTLLDPSYVLWRELGDAGQRLLAEVDILARTYHWPEREILALSAARRRMYLSLVDA